MVGLLGRGGMGEVYRADDLKLGQPVALKFLPRDVEQDPDRLERFLTEVRMSLKVTHPNVCRVHDIGQADGRHFLSMEYVDGEDLASLLRRIGRLPEDKAVEISRQLCAGLQAAHDEGVLHRDLKPANVMLDGRGRAKITDFGLAGATEGITGLEARAGTPQYMAPEQVTGGALTKQTDIYSMGLVLYELFTGKRAFEARNLNDPASLSSTPTSPSAHVSGLDPVVERAILRCVDPDPAKRPASAAALAASLPGGDPLAMAVAAGETPSPEMVAQAEGKGALRPAVAAACLVTILVGLAGVWFVLSAVTLTRYVPLPLSPVELTVAARSALAELGYTEPPLDTAYGFQGGTGHLAALEREDTSADRWEHLATVKPSVVWFWYRESPVMLLPMNGIGWVDAVDPPQIRPGMKYISLDPEGHLSHFHAVPPDLPAAPGPWPEPDWPGLLELAGLDPATFELTESEWAPPVASDARRTWNRDDLRIEAAAFRGRLVWFEMFAPYEQPENGTATPRTIGALAQQLLAVVFVLTVMVVAGLLARRNVRLGRSDTRGATRLAAFLAAVGFASYVLRSSSLTLFLSGWGPNLALSLFIAAMVWIAYLAIEPYVRRLWPDTLITWSRMLDGRLRDPLIGSHLLIGGVGGIVASGIFFLPMAAPWFGLPSPTPPFNGMAALHGFSWTLAAYLELVRSAFSVPVIVLLLVLIFRVIFRRPWLAYLAFFGAVAAFALLTSPSLLEACAFFGIPVLAVLLLTRFGLFTMLVTVAFSSWNFVPLTLDPGSWYFPLSVVAMLLFAAVAIYGFVISLGGRLKFTDPVLD